MWTGLQKSSKIASRSTSSGNRRFYLRISPGARAAAQKHMFWFAWAAPPCPPPRPSLHVLLLLAAAPFSIDYVGAVCVGDASVLCVCVCGVWRVCVFGFGAGRLRVTLLYESPGGNQVDGLPPVCNHLLFL